MIAEQAALSRHGMLGFNWQPKAVTPSLMIRIGLTLARVPSTIRP
jgi:hypothetical protein